MQTIQDLVFMQKVGIRIDADDFAKVLVAENTHRDFSACFGCCAITQEQHQPSCPRSSVLFEADWFEIVRAWDANR